MKEIFHKIYSKYGLIYRSFAFLVSVFLIMQFLPKGLRFKYEFQQGKTWGYETLYAPFEFSIKKSDSDIAKERKSIEENSVIYYSRDTLVFYNVVNKFEDKANVVFPSDANLRYTLIEKGVEFLEHCYGNGVLGELNQVKGKDISIIEKDNSIEHYKISDFVYINTINDEIDKYFVQAPYKYYKNVYNSILLEILQPNIYVNEHFTDVERQQNLNEMVLTRGIIEKGEFIIAKGEKIGVEKYNILRSLQDNYQGNDLSDNNKYSYLAYLFLSGAIIGIVYLYLYTFNREVFFNNPSLAFILTNMLIMFFAVCFLGRINSNYIYVVPICMLPLIFRAFFDLRLGLFVHTMTVLLISLMLNNSFQYAFISIIAGNMVMLNRNEIHHRVTIFFTATYTTLIYIVAYFLYRIMSEGLEIGSGYEILLIFVVNGIMMLFSQPIIYIYEKVFGLVSDVSLLELSDINSPLLRKLSDKAPGSFQHSMQVANLAEAAAIEIGANSLLVRVGALYHDIGKMVRPFYFTENQKTTVNPHDELSPEESAKIIIDHVLDGVEIARKNKIPDRIIDFIRTHHGNTLTYYFYKKEEALKGKGNFDQGKFRYNCPRPFSRETVILMMSDAIEAGTKSLKNPNYDAIKEFVDKKIKEQYDDGQYENADITLKEIAMVKKVLIKKLVDIYHLRIEYPD